MNTLQKSLLIITSVCSVVGTTLPMENSGKNKNKEALKQALFIPFKKATQEWASDLISNEHDNSKPGRIAYLLAKAREHGIKFTDEDLQPLTKKIEIQKKTTTCPEGMESHIEYAYPIMNNFWFLHNTVSILHADLFNELLLHGITRNKERGKGRITPLSILLKILKKETLDDHQFNIALDMLSRLVDSDNFSDQETDNDSVFDHYSARTGPFFPNLTKILQDSDLVKSSSDSESDTSNSEINSPDPASEKKDDQ